MRFDFPVRVILALAPIFCLPGGIDISQILDPRNPASGTVLLFATYNSKNDDFS
jgi:hypothetical protein